MFHWSPPASSVDVQTSLFVFNEFLHLYGGAEVGLRSFAGVHLPVPGYDLLGHAGSVADVSAVMAAICTAVSIGSSTTGTGGHHVHELAEICAFVSSGIAAGLGDPIAIGSAGTLLLKAFVELAQTINEVQAVIPCWPNCQQQLTFEQWLYL